MGRRGHCRSKDSLGEVQKDNNRMPVRGSSGTPLQIWGCRSSDVVKGEAGTEASEVGKGLAPFIILF